MTDARPPTAGSPSYIQNGASPQASSSFNISNTGTANIFNAATQYNLGGFRILSNAGTNNLFTGVGAGIQNTTGVQNTFLWTACRFRELNGRQQHLCRHERRSSQHLGSTNSFFGTFAGESNTIGSDNSFFGERRGKVQYDGLSNSFFGHNAVCLIQSAIKIHFRRRSGNLQHDRCWQCVFWI
jgi:hypothetical protein